MRLPKSTSPALWLAGITAALALTALAIHAAEPDKAQAWATRAPDPDIARRIQAFERHTGRLADAPMAFVGPDSRRVYYFIASCCDQFNRLYDADGRFICAPSGGFTGAGDGQCPDWAHDRRLWSRMSLPTAAGEQQPSAPR